MPFIPRWITIPCAAIGLLACTRANPVFVSEDAGAEARDAPPDIHEAARPAEAPEETAPADASTEPDLITSPDVPQALDAAPEAELDVGSGPDRQDAPSVDVGAVLDVTAPDVAPCSVSVMGTGTGLNAEYFDNSDFTGTRVTRTDANIDWSFGTGSPDNRLDSDNFSARWTGQLQSAFSGEHTFITSYNDGMRMFLDDRVVLYRWGVHIANAEDRATVNLEAGRKYNLRFEFFDQGGDATARLFWESPCQSRQAIPRRQLYPVAPAAPVCATERAPGSGTGLKVEYFSGQPSQSPLATGTSPRVDYNWGTGTPATGVPADFSARWTGKLEAPIDGPLTIYLSTDDVGRLRLDGRLLLDSWSEPFGPQEIAVTIDVQSGRRYDLSLEYRDDTGGAFAHLYWSWPCHPREIIPTGRLYLP